MVSRHWPEAHHCSRRAPTLSSSNQRKTTESIQDGGATKLTLGAPSSWFFGPLSSKEYIIVVQNLYYCFPAAKTATSTSTSRSAIIPTMDKIMTNFEIPCKLGTDNGLPFSSQNFANFGKHKGFEHTRVTPYAPCANSAVNHFMRN